MAAVTRDGWPPGTDRRRGRGMIDSDNDEQATPPGKKWECCTACQGRGKVLVDDVVSSSIPRAGSVPPLNPGADAEGIRRYALIYIFLDGC